MSAPSTNFSANCPRCGKPFDTSAACSCEAIRSAIVPMSTPTPSNERVEKLAVKLILFTHNIEDAKSQLTAFADEVRKEQEATDRIFFEPLLDANAIANERDDLRAQLAAMTAERDDLRSLNVAITEQEHADIQTLRADRDRYRAACEAMEADKKRLDWLGGAKAADYLEGPCQWQINYNMRLRADTLRAAIDAAMQQHPTSDILTPKTTDKASDVTQQEAKP